MNGIGNNWDRIEYGEDYLVSPKRRPAISHTLLQEILLSRKERPIRKAATKKILDLGCGSGALFEGCESRFLETYAEICGLDASNSLLSLAQKKYPNFSFALGNIEDAPEIYSGQLFDVLVLSHVLEMVSSPVAVLRAAARIMDGPLYIEFFERPQIRDDRVEVRYFSPEEGGEAYLRRKISASSYNLWLQESGLRLVHEFVLPGRAAIHELRQL